MKNISFFLTRFLLIGTLFAGGVSIAAENRSLADVMPVGAVAYLELNGLGSKVDQFRKSKLYADLLESPQFKKFASSRQYRTAQTGRKVAETFIGMDLWTAAEKMLGGQMALGLYPKDDGPEPEAVLILRVKDVEALKKIRGRLEPFILLAGDKIKKEGLPGGVDLFKLENKMLVAAKGNWLAAAENRGLLKQAIKMLNGQPGKAVGKEKGFAKYRANMGRRHLAQMYVDLAAVSDFLGGRLGLPEKMKDGGASFFFHGMLELAARSSYLGVTLDAGEAGFALTGGIEGGPAILPEKYQWYFSDPKGKGTPDIPEVPGLLGGITIHRKFGDWYRLREKLLEERLLAGFDQFESGIGNFFPGRDFGEDILPALGSTFTIVTAHQTYQHLDGAPGLKIPAFAFIFDLDKPQEGADLFQLIFQTIVTITNFENKEKNRQPWVMAAQAYKGQSLAFAKYMKKPKGDKLPISANFQPAAVLVGKKFILSSTVELGKALVDSLQNPDGGAKRSNRNFNFEILPSALVKVVEDNRGQLVAQAIQKGETGQQAKWGVDTLQRVLKSIGLIRLSTSVGEKDFRIKLEGHWQ